MLMLQERERGREEERDRERDRETQRETETQTETERQGIRKKHKIDFAFKVECLLTPVPPEIHV